MRKESIKRFLGERALRPWWRLRKRLERARKDLRRAFLRNRDFTVISNNCFGGFVYQRYALPYRTPTAGLFFMPDDYLKLLSDPRRYFAAPLRFIDPLQARCAAALGAADPAYGSYPVARLLDVEVYFMHYATPEEAREKWTRRCARMNWDNLLVKFCDQNGATEEPDSDLRPASLSAQGLFYRARLSRRGQRRAPAGGSRSALRARRDGGAALFAGLSPHACAQPHAKKITAAGAFCRFFPSFSVKAIRRKMP